MSQNSKEYYLKLCEQMASWLGELDLDRMPSSEVNQMISGFSIVYEEFSDKIESETFILNDEDAQVYILGGTSLISLFAYKIDWDNAKYWCDYLLYMISKFNWIIHPQITAVLENWQKRSTHNIRMLNAVVDEPLDNPSVARGCLEWIILIVIVFFIIKFIFF